MGRAISRDRHIQWKPASTGVSHVHHMLEKEMYLLAHLSTLHKVDSSIKILRAEMKS